MGVAGVYVGWGWVGSGWASGLHVCLGRWGRGAVGMRWSCVHVCHGGWVEVRSGGGQRMGF